MTRIVPADNTSSAQSFDQTLTTLHLSPLFGTLGSAIFSSICFAIALGIIIVTFRRIPRRHTGMQSTSRSRHHMMLTDASRVDWLRRMLVFVCIGIIGLGPSITLQSQTVAVKNTDVLIAVDTTGSMAVHDAQYGSQQQRTRLQVAQQIVKDTLTRFSDANYAAVRVGTTGSLSVPLTPDALAIANWSSTLRPEPTTTSQGSNLDKALDALIPLARDTKKTHPQDTIIVIYITDGEQTQNTTRRSFASLRNTVDHALVIGVGSKQGATVPTVDTDGVIHDQTPVVDPSTGQPGISALDEKNLADIADEMSGSMCITDATNTCITQQDISSADSISSWRIEQSTKTDQQEELIIWPLVVLLALLMCWEAGVWLYRSRRTL